jgi:hypothetical protein
MYKDAQHLAGGLLAEPFPSGAEPDADLPDTFTPSWPITTAAVLPRSVRTVGW